MHFVISGGSDSGIVEARRKVTQLSNGVSVSESVARQASAPARPDSSAFNTMLSDLDQMSKDLESCLLGEDCTGVFVVNFHAC